MEELGRELRQRRIELGYTIEEVSSKTSLSVKNIRQLESGDISSFKEDLTYIPFYFKNYCKILNIDYNELRSKLDDSIESYTTAMKLEELNQKKELENNIRKNMTLPNKAPVKINYGLISFLVIIIVLIAVIGYGIIHMLSQPKSEPTTPPSVVETKPQVTPAPAVTQPEVKEEKIEINAKSQTIYEVKLKKEAAFKIVLEEDSWMTFQGSTAPLAEKVYRKGENPSLNVKPHEKVVVRLGVVKSNYFMIDNQKIEWNQNLNKDVPQTFEIHLIGE